MDTQSRKDTRTQNELHQSARLTASLQFFRLAWALMAGLYSAEDPLHDPPPVAAHSLISWNRNRALPSLPLVSPSVKSSSSAAAQQAG